MFIVIREDDCKLNFIGNLVTNPNEIEIINYGNTIQSSVKIHQSYLGNMGYIRNLLEIIVNHYDNLPDFLVVFMINNLINQKKLEEDLKLLIKKIKEKNYNILNPIEYCRPILNYLKNSTNIVKFSEEIIGYRLDLMEVFPIYEKEEIIVITKENIVKRPKESYIQILENLVNNPENNYNCYLLFSKIIGY